MRSMFGSTVSTEDQKKSRADVKEDGCAYIKIKVTSQIGGHMSVLLNDTVFLGHVQVGIYSAHQTLRPISLVNVITPQSYSWYSNTFDTERSILGVHDGSIMTRLFGSIMSDDDKWRIESRGGLVCANQYCDVHYKLHTGYIVRKDRTKQHNVGTITLRNKEVLWYAASEDGGPPMGFEQAVRENDLYQQSSRGVANELYPDVDPNTMLSVEPPLVAWLKSKRLVFSPCILTAMYQMLSFPNEIKFEEDEAVIETVPWGDSILNERALQLQMFHLQFSRL